MEKQYNFYSDESHNNKVINNNTFNSANYYDNFITVMVGWELDNEKEIHEKYTSFENKYEIRKNKEGELKSDTMKNNDLKNGVASIKKDNINFYKDFLNLFSNDMHVYYFSASKLEYILLSFLKREDYENSDFIPTINYDAMIYTITKAIITYKPLNVVEALLSNDNNALYYLKRFFIEKINQNKANLALKKHENNAFKNVVVFLDKFKAIKSFEWNYEIAFWGFEKYLNEHSIISHNLIIDKEGTEKTISAARKVIGPSVKDGDSKEFFGIRLADMVAGVLGKLMNSLHNSLSSTKLNKTLLREKWFDLTEEKLMLYKKLHYVFIELNASYHKSFSGIYADDLLELIALLNYFNEFESVAELKSQNPISHGERFNSCLVDHMDNYFNSRFSN